MQEDFLWKSSKLCPYAGESRSCNDIFLGLHPGSQLRSLGLSLPFFNPSASSSHAKVSQGGEHHLCPLKVALEMVMGQVNAPQTFISLWTSLIPKSTLASLAILVLCF